MGQLGNVGRRQTADKSMTRASLLARPTPDNSIVGPGSYHPAKDVATLALSGIAAVSTRRSTKFVRAPVATERSWSVAEDRGRKHCSSGEPQPLNGRNRTWRVDQERAILLRASDEGHRIIDRFDSNPCSQGTAWPGNF